MQKKAEKVFYVDNRRIRRLVKNIYLNLLIVFVFFGLFHLLFREHPLYDSWIRWLLAGVFLLAGALLVWADIQAVRKAQSIYCQVQPEGLEFFDGKKTSYYPWSSFQRVEWNPNKISLIYPCCFHTSRGQFYLYRWMGDQETLLPLIFRHIRGQVEMAPDVPAHFPRAFD